MKRNEESVIILMADDDQDDCLLVREAFAESCLHTELYFVENGETLMDYLLHRGRFEDMHLSPRPNLILLDLNMPKKDGREALREIKADPHLRSIPIVVLTTSKEEEDVYFCYSLGASSYIVKRVAFEDLVEVVKLLCKYWFEVVELPPEKKGILNE